MKRNPIEYRPIECSQCKKKVHVNYSEIVSDSVTTWQMCRDCPILQAKLQGEDKEIDTTEKKKELCCSYCHTSLESVLMGEPLGCKECYQIFRHVLVNQLIDADQLPPHLTSGLPKNSKLHLGKAPHIAEDGVNVTRMQELTKALNEAVKEENYEEAAWLRDQINLFTERVDDKP